MSIEFKDGHQVVLSLDCIKGMQHPEEENFVILKIPVFTSTSSGHLMLSPAQLDSFVRSSFIKEVAKWMTKRSSRRNS